MPTHDEQARFLYARRRLQILKRRYHRRADQ